MGEEIRAFQYYWVVCGCYSVIPSWGEIVGWVSDGKGHEGKEKWLETPKMTSFLYVDRLSAGLGMGNGQSVTSIKNNY